MEKRLYRSKNNKMIAGVCAGLAEYFNQDPVLWRLGAIVVFILSGFMPLILVYLIAWVIVPEDTGVRYTVENE